MDGRTDIPSFRDATAHLKKIFESCLDLKRNKLHERIPHYLFRLPSMSSLSCFRSCRDSGTCWSLLSRTFRVCKCVRSPISFGRFVKQLEFISSVWRPSMQLISAFEVRIEGICVVKKWEIFSKDFLINRPADDNKWRINEHLILRDSSTNTFIPHLLWAADLFIMSTRLNLATYVFI